MYGPHVGRGWLSGSASTAQRLEAARAHAASVGFRIETAQIFAGDVLNEEARELKQYLKDHRLRAFMHGAFTDLPWSGKNGIIHSIRDRMVLCAEAGIEGIVIHLGRGPDDVVAQAGRLLNAAVKTQIFLEIPSGRAHPFSAPGQLNRLFARIVKAHDPKFVNFGLCVDTAHLWAGGLDISRYDAAKAWLDEIKIPPDRLLFHLNDNYEDLGGGKDTHAPLFHGKIWKRMSHKPGKSGLAAFIERAEERRIPCIFERNPLRSKKNGGSEKRMSMVDSLENDYEVVQDITRRSN